MRPLHGSHSPPIPCTDTHLQAPGRHLSRLGRGRMMGQTPAPITAATLRTSTGTHRLLPQLPVLNPRPSPELSPCQVRLWDPSLNPHPKACIAILLLGRSTRLTPHGFLNWHLQPQDLLLWTAHEGGILVLQPVLAAESFPALGPAQSWEPFTSSYGLEQYP